MHRHRELTLPSQIGHEITSGWIIYQHFRQPFFRKKGKPMPQFKCVFVKREDNFLKKYMATIETRHYHKCEAKYVYNWFLINKVVFIF